MRRFPFKLVCSSIQFESSVHQALIHQGPNHVYPYEERLPLTTSATSTASSHFVANESCLECANYRRDVSEN